MWTAPASAAHLLLRIVSSREAERFGLVAHEFGRAWLPTDGGFGQVAAVYGDRARKIEKEINSPEGTLLGHLVAHELGHLLLGAGSHAPTGIMHIPWYLRELELTRQGTLHFTPFEAKQMQLGVRLRMQDGSRGVE